MVTLVPPPLSAPFATAPSSDGVRPTPATLSLVRSQVQALLDSTSSYHALPESDRERLRQRLTHIASYAAECARDVWSQSEKLGQRPVLRERETRKGPLAMSAAAPPRPGAPQERPGAVNQVARVTQEIVRAVAFPVFVADLIKGTFNAIIQSNIQQLEQFERLLENVTKTVDEFMDGNITDAQARDWLQQRYPDHIKVDGGKAVPVDGADERPAPNFQRDLNTPGSPSLDADSIESDLVPAARRRIAESRLQILSTMVLMGVNRIVVTGGKIRATMGFHIDATDRTHEEHATDLDFRAAAAGSFGFGPWSVSASTSFSYVSSTRQNSDSDIHVDTDLTGEVEIHFKSDYFPVERFANAGTIGRIQSNTPVPDANPLGDTPPVGGTIGAYQSPRPGPPRSRPTNAPTLPPIVNPPPEGRTPVKPTAPVEGGRHIDAPKDSIWYDPSAHPDTAGGDGAGGGKQATKPADGGGGTEKPAADKSKSDAAPAKDGAKGAKGKDAGKSAGDGESKVAPSGDASKPAADGGTNPADSATENIASGLEEAYAGPRARYSPNVAAENGRRGRR
jgi:hypothetical protein